MRMHRTETHRWLTQSDRRRTVLRELIQPLTVTQLARRAGLPRDLCSYVLRELTSKRLVQCVNPAARRSRLYWLTDGGHHSQRKVRSAANLPPLTFDFPAIDWAQYGEMCYRHRAAIIRTLTEPLQPAAIKRRARARDGALRMSANNVRDVLRELRRQGVVREVRVEGLAHKRFELTDAGQSCHYLLARAELLEF